MIVISHRLSTLGNVDEILVLSRGVVAERGTYRELKSQDGIFAHLLTEQNRYNLDDDDEDDSLVHSVFTATLSHLPAIHVNAIPRNPAQASASLPNFPCVSRLIETSSDRSTGSLTAIRVPSSQDGKKTQAERHNGNGHEKAIAIIDTLQERQEDTPVKASILVEVDGQSVEEHQLDKRIMTVGRLPNSYIQISSQRVSRSHGIVRWNNGTWVIEDA